jgi:hypothetical protein
MAAQNFDEWFNDGHKSWDKRSCQVVWNAAIKFAVENLQQSTNKRKPKSAPSRNEKDYQ